MNSLNDSRTSRLSFIDIMALPLDSLQAAPELLIIIPRKNPLPAIILAAPVGWVRTKECLRPGEPDHRPIRKGGSPCRLRNADVRIRQISLNPQKVHARPPSRENGERRGRNPGAVSVPEQIIMTDARWISVGVSGFFCINLSNSPIGLKSAADTLRILPDDSARPLWRRRGRIYAFRISICASSFLNSIHDAPAKTSP